MPWDTDDDMGTDEGERSFRDLAFSGFRARDLGEDLEPVHIEATNPVDPLEASDDDQAGEPPSVVIPDPDRVDSEEMARSLGGGATRLGTRAREDLRAIIAHLPKGETRARALGPKARRAGVCAAVLFYCDGRREVLK